MECFPSRSSVKAARSSYAPSDGGEGAIKYNRIRPEKAWRITFSSVPPYKGSHGIG